MKGTQTEKTPIDCPITKSNSVWYYFGKLFPSTAQAESDDGHYCKICAHRYSVTTSTTTLVRHMLQVHNIDLKTVASDQEQQRLLEKKKQVILKMSQRCRLCLRDDSILTNTADNHEGLLISVLIMIVCPVTITAEDKLPKCICEECLEIVISAYKLRSSSGKNERFMLSITEDLHPDFTTTPCQKQFEDSPKPEEPELIVKSEKFPEDENVEENNCSSQPIKSAENPVGKFTVNCNSIQRKRKSKKSLVWKYAGQLCDGLGKIINDGYIYCSLCMAKGHILRYKHSDTTTTPLTRHMLKLHGIEKESETKPAVCDYCNIQCMNKLSLLRHMILRHVKGCNKTKDATLRSGMRVFCGKAHEDSTKVSFVWKYFGKLVDINGCEIEGVGWDYCRLCTESNNRKVRRFSSTGSTSILHQHLKRAHGILENADKSEYFAHRRKSHMEPEVLNYVCQVCSKPLKNNETLLEHLRVHGDKHNDTIRAPTRLLRYQCDKCAKYFSRRKTLLVMHIKDF